MTSPTRTELSSTATELRQSEVPCNLWSSLWSHLDASGEPPAALQTIYGSTRLTIEVKDAVCIDTTTIYAVATTGVVIAWPERAPTDEDDLRAHVSALWAEDWDSDDDAVYDDW